MNQSVEIYQELYKELEGAIDRYYNHMCFNDASKAPSFNMLSPLMGSRNRENFEVQLNSCIKYFLDPKEHHNQKRAFLDIFLKKLNLDDAKLFENAPNVQLEKKMNGRRIDINLSWPDFELGIEVKVWSSDGSNQIKNYVVCYQKSKKEFMILYLTPYGNPPSTKSVENWQKLVDSKKGKAISIQDWLLQLVASWAAFSKNKAKNLSLFLSDFEVFLKRIYIEDERDLLNYLGPEIIIKQKDVKSLLNLVKSKDERAPLFNGNEFDVERNIKHIADVYQSLFERIQDRSETARKSLLAKNLEGLSITGLKKNNNRGKFDLTLKNEGIKIQKTFHYLSHQIIIHGNVPVEKLTRKWTQDSAGKFKCDLPNETTLGNLVQEFVGLLEKLRSKPG